MSRDPILTLCTLDTGPTAPEAFLRAWSLAPETVMPLGLTVALALAGWARRADRDDTPARRAAFLAGWGLLVVALVSPLCRLAATLVSGHMAQFMVLALAAPLLLALARPWRTLAAGLPRTLRDRCARPPGLSRSPIGPITVLYGAGIWLWHAPEIYTVVLLDARVHVAAFALLVAVSTAFWSVVVNARGNEGRALLALFATMTHTGLLGAILTFSATPLYPVQIAGALAWGLDPLHDQQLAGLIMWVPGNLFYLGAALALFGRWLERRARAAHTASARL